MFEQSKKSAWLSGSADKFISSPDFVRFEVLTATSMKTAIFRPNFLTRSPARCQVRGKVTILRTEVVITCRRIKLAHLSGEVATAYAASEE
jgi:hypothetical protein